jgi:hypothetical protein
MSLRSIAGTFGAALLVVACSSAAASPPGATSEAFLIRRANAPAQACMDALLSGTLVRHPASGLGVDGGGQRYAVEWPFGWSARIETGRVVLVDDKGALIAREGDKVEMGGGLGNAIWYTCGDVQVTEAAG